MLKIVLFQAAQFSISTQISSISPLDIRTGSGATIPDQTGPRSDGNKGVLCIPKSSCITETSPSNCLVLYTEYSFVGGLTPQQRSSQCNLLSQPTGQEEKGRIIKTRKKSKEKVGFFLLGES